MKQLSRTRKIVLLSFVFFTLMVLVAIFSEGGILAVSEFKQNPLSLKKENQKLAHENSRIRKDIKALKTDPYAIEKVARESLNLAKPDEIVYQIVREAAKPPPVVKAP